MVGCGSGSSWEWGEFVTGIRVCVGEGMEMQCTSSAGSRA